MRRGVLPSSKRGELEQLIPKLRSDRPGLLSVLHGAVAAELEVPEAALQWSERDDELYARSASVLSEVFVVEGGVVVITASSDRRFRFQTLSGRAVPDFEESDLTVMLSAMVSGDATDLLDEFAAAIRDGVGLDLEEYRFPSTRFEQIREEAVSEDLPSDEATIRVAETLADRDLRTLAVSIKSSRGLLSKDLPKVMGRQEGSDELVAQLIAGGVAATESVVVCSTTQTQVARVPDKKSLSKLAKEGLRCACGKPIDQETPEDLLTVTDAGSLLLDKSRWLSVLVREELVNFGVPASDVLLECMVGTDEIDCIACVSGEVMIFELKDKVFSVGNAYSFGAKMSLFNAEQSVIVTTEEVSSDVKTHFSRTRASDRRTSGRVQERETIHYVEGADFRSGLRKVISGVYRQDAARLLETALNRLAPTPESLLVAAIKEPAEDRS